MDFDDLSYGRVGSPLQGVKVKLIDWDEVSIHVMNSNQLDGYIGYDLIERVDIIGQISPTLGERY